MKKPSSHEAPRHSPRLAAQPSPRGRILVVLTGVTLGLGSTYGFIRPRLSESAAESVEATAAAEKPQSAPDRRRYAVLLSRLRGESTHPVVLGPLPEEQNPSGAPESGPDAEPELAEQLDIDHPPDVEMVSDYVSQGYTDFNNILAPDVFTLCNPSDRCCESIVLEKPTAILRWLYLRQQNARIIEKNGYYRIQTYDGGYFEMAWKDWNNLGPSDPAE